MLNRTKLLAAGLVSGVWLGLPAGVWAGDVWVCAELKAAVADAAQGFASHRGAANAQASQAGAPGKTYQAKKTMTGAKACSVVDVSVAEPTMRMRQTGYTCQFPSVFKIDKALRTQLTRCIAGEVDDPSDPADFTLWVERVSSGEGYRGTEVNAQVHPLNGLTLWVRQSVCTNTGDKPACEE